MKLWIKIALLNVVIVVSLGVLIGLAVRSIIIDSMREEVTRQGLSIARNLSDRIADPLLLNDLYKINDAIGDVLKTEPDVEYVFVTGKDGALFAHTFDNGHPSDLLRWNPFGLEKLSAVQLLATEKGLVRDIGVRVFGGMNPELHIGIREERIAQTLNRIRNLVVASTAAVILIGIVLSFLLSRLVTKPLNTLVEFTHILSQGEFGKRVEVMSGDEVGELSGTFNNLSQELKLYRERMEESYRQMLRTEKLTALGRLSAGLAHELRNPLTSIKVLFQAFKDNPALTKEDMRIVLSAAEQMDDLLTRFLRFARSDDFEISEVHVNSVIKQVLNLTRFQINNRSVQVRMELTKLPPIRADRSMLQQGLLNLVLNALEAMPDGGTLTISSRAENGCFGVSVKDTGPGIPVDIQGRIFDPFFTTKGDGTGLGLSIVYNIINLHKGEVGFESNGGGTTFTLKIPVNI